MCAIDTWEDLKRELRNQFLPDNVEYNARLQHRELKHTDKISEFVSKFSVLMLDLPDMAEKDRLFYFLEGLQPWARTELQRQRVRDVASALAAAERLTDLGFELNNLREETKDARNGGGALTRKSGSSSSGEAESNPPNSHRGEGRGSNERDTASSRPRTPTGGHLAATYWNRPAYCILCKGGHRIPECPY